MLEGKCHSGEAGWTLKDVPESVTVCNCTSCRRYGVLWAYGYIGDDIHSIGKTKTYRRKDDGAIDFHFCTKCGCVTHYVKTAIEAGGRHRTAVNVRMTDPALILDLPIVQFDGLETFEDLPRDGRKVSDVWF
ncbi:GFA family protein [Alphaproteobacteria bacterium]|nr:GFA family protein [Alphaproteobacteria bacterium]